MKQILIFAAFVLLFASCDRDMDFDIISVTDPTLTVIAETKTVNGTATTYTKVNGATVKIYNTEADFNANGTPLVTKTTSADGKAVFTKTELVAKGTFYVHVTSGNLTGSGTTPYLLLNDGETSFFVELK